MLSLINLIIQGNEKKSKRKNKKGLAFFEKICYNKNSKICNKVIPAGEPAVPCTCNPLQQGWFPLLRAGFVRSVPILMYVEGRVSRNEPL